MNKKDLSAVLLASVLGSAAFVAPVFAEETNTDPQEVETAPVEETTTVDDTNVLDETETTTPVYTNQFLTVNGSTYYFDNNGNKVTGIQTINGELYYFDGNGVLQSSVEYEGYYFGADGKAVKSDWVKFFEGYKYYDENGQVVKGTSTSPVMKEIDGSNYAFDLNGYMLTGWQEVDGTKYYFAKNGVRTEKYEVKSDSASVSETSGTWVKDNGLWKYKLSSGDYAENTVLCIDNYYYAFDNSGYMLTDATTWVTINPYSSGFVHADKNGHLVKGWLRLYSGSYEYYGSDYFAYTDGLYTIGNKQYYFVNTTMVASKQFVYDGQLYKADNSGAVTLVNTNGKTDWVKTNNGWCYIENGEVVTNTFKVIDSKKYYFSYDGKMMCDEMFGVDDVHYYANKNGYIIEKKNAWYQNEEGQWLYFREDGDLTVSGFYPVGNQVYLFNYGFLQKGVVDYYGKTYLTDKSGAVLLNKGWKNIDGQWRYVQDDGTALYNSFVTEGNKKYYMNDYGVMIANQVKLIDGSYYVFNESGVVTQCVAPFNGWKKIQNVWYYGKNGNMTYTGRVGNNYVSDGKMLTNTIVGAYGETQYYVDYNGEIQKGWIKYYDTWLYADPSTGVLPKNQWLKQGNNWYYIQDGYMVNYLTSINGQVNAFDANGVWKGVVKTNSWYKETADNKWIYLGSNGQDASQLKLKIDGATYYFNGYGMGSRIGMMLAQNCSWYDPTNDCYYWINSTGTGIDTTTGWKKTSDSYYAYVKNGKLLTGLQTINGKTYYFDSMGYLLQGIKNIDGKAYVFDKNGNPVQYKEGWNALNGQWFYIQNGKALTDTYINGYFIDGTGLTTTGLYYGNYAGEALLVIQGKVAKNQWVHVVETYYNYYGTPHTVDYWYYADANGHKVRSQWIGNYYFDDNGEMVKNAWIGNYHVGADGKWDKTR